MPEICLGESIPPDTAHVSQDQNNRVRIYHGTLLLIQCL
jgi:hypothetical protein